MEIIKSAEFHIEEPTAVGIGKFDGIHLGHIELLKALLEKKNEGLKVVIFTFDLSATSFFSGRDIKEITTLEEKEIIFEQLGVDILIEYPLNEKSASIMPDIFVTDFLVKRLNMKFVAAGNDISFGYKGEGNEALLKTLSKTNGYDVRIVDKLKYKNRDISSTFVREEIEAGNMSVVTELLGHPYSFAGTVQKGFKLGRTLGFPTMNLYPDEKKILPPMGVYYSKVLYENTTYYGITNIGTRPTVANENDTHVSVETFLFDFDQDMYDKHIITEMIEFKRPECKFDSKESLKNQVLKDIEEGKLFFEKYGIL